MRAVDRTRLWARTAVAAVAGALVLGVTACGSSQDSDSGAGITITHALGATVVDGVPAKIVTLGAQWLDTALALGVTPVGYIDNVAVTARNASPWQPEGALASATEISTTGNVAEQVAALEPDLILADPFIADQETYDDLSKIAATVPGLSASIITPWQDQVTTLGDVLGKQDQASRVVSGVDEKIAAITAANPGLAGKTFVSTWLAGPSQLMVLTDPKDGSSKMFADLGMTIPQNLQDLPAHQGRVTLSPERVDELTADLLLAGYSPGMDEQYRGLPGFGELPSVRKGSVVFLTTQEISAVNQPTALSVPYILDKLDPAFAAAAQ
ncbi:ABC transporter substrate-binding protein [Nocardia shimofusensis]|uniref:ABC transporter substrate-binding protein n=1 Tax=Nocardia shimofusensis TaxID=228596 RepID=UPI0008362881|nr:ABC transporter substrate-binding protein [Nocardia shimofusensis]